MTNIVFVSEMKDMKVDASSTQIMTYNLLYGLKMAGYNVTFIAVCNDACDKQSVIDDYSPIVSKIYCVPSAMNLLSKKRNLLSKYLVQIKCSFISTWYKKQLDSLSLEDDFEIVLTHLPAIESAFYANAIKKEKPSLRYIEFWSDPYARSGLSSNDKLPLKRLIMKILEYSILEKADEVVYGTSLLRDTQAKEYSNLASIMRSCDVSYTVYSNKIDVPSFFDNDYPLIGYIGGYKSTYRNIEPLYRTFCEHPELGNLILCGFSDVERNEKKNIKIIKRCSPQYALGIEDQLDIHVCLLNMTMSQIPGKLFYQTNSKKPILVILDGPDKEIIKKYLEKFNRFEFTENNDESVYLALKRIIEKGSNVSVETPELLSPVRFAESIIVR